MKLEPLHRGHVAMYTQCEISGNRYDGQYVTADNFPCGRLHLTICHYAASKLYTDTALQILTA